MTSNIPESSDIQYANDTRSADGNKEVLLLPIKKKMKYQLGKTRVCCWIRKKPLCSLGPDWLLFLFSFVLIESIGIAISFKVVTSRLSKIILLALVGLEGFVFLYTALKNPGIASISKRSKDEDLDYLSRFANFCKKCQILKDETTYHCDVCDVCIQGYDHHCPWTGKCIGAGNFKAFYTFITTTLIYFVFCLVITFRDLLYQ